MVCFKTTFTPNKYGSEAADNLKIGKVVTSLAVVEFGAVTAEGPGNTYQLRHVLTDKDVPTLINAARLKHAVLKDLDTLRLQHQQWQIRPGPDVAPAGRPLETDSHNAGNSKASTTPPREPDEPRQEQALPPIEEVVNLSTNNKGKWCKVKFRGSPTTEWRIRGSIPIPEELINHHLRTHTWQGKPRKRTRKRHWEASYCRIRM